MLGKLQSGFTTVINAWEQFIAGDGTEFKSDNWTVEIRSNGEYVVLSGYEMLFIFPAITMVNRLLPKSNNIGDLFNIDFLVEHNYFGRLSVDEVVDGFNTIELAIRSYYKESINEYRSTHWKASVHFFNGDSVDNTFIILAGYGHIFMYSLSDYCNQIRPMMPGGQEYSGLVRLLDMELHSDFNCDIGHKFSYTLWPSVLHQRFILFNTAQYIEILINKNLCTNEQRILERGYLDLSDNAAQRILSRNSNIKFSQIKEQYSIIDKYIPDFGKELLKKSNLQSKHFKQFLLRIPEIFFINEPRNRVIAQMCLWAYRQSLPERKIDSLDYKEIIEALPSFEMHIMNKPQENEIMEFLIDYIKKLRISGVPSEFRENNAHLCLDKLLQNWIAPTNERSFDSFINKTVKSLYYDGLRGKTGDISLNSIEEGISSEDYQSDETRGTNEVKQKRLKKKHNDGVMTVDEAVLLFFKDTTFLTHYSSKPESLRRWIYSQIDKGKIKSTESKRIKVLREGIYKETSECLLNKESIELIKKIFIEKSKKKELVEYQVNHKGISARAARKRIKENLDKGISIEEFAQKILAEKLNPLTE